VQCLGYLKKYESLCHYVIYSVEHLQDFALLLVLYLGWGTWLIKFEITFILFFPLVYEFFTLILSHDL
jgi:hypothetical protein